MLSIRKGLTPRFSISIVITLFLFCFVGLATGVFLNHQVIGNVAAIKTANVGDVEAQFGVYEDFNCTFPLTTIDWGVLEPGTTKRFLAYLRNESNVPISLNMTIQNWIPSEAKSYISVSWDHEGVSLEANLVIAVVFTLSVSSDVSGITNFSFEIVITGSA